MQVAVLVVPVALVGGNGGLRRKRRSGKQQCQEACPYRQGGGGRAFLPVAEKAVAVQKGILLFENKYFQQEQQHRHGKKIGIAGFIVGDIAAFERHFVEFRQFGKNGFHARRDIVGLHVEAFAGLGYFFEHGAVDAGNDHVSFGIFLVSHHLPVLVFGNGRALGRTHAHRADHDAFLCGIPGGGNGVVFMVLAVADNDDGFVVRVFVLGVEILRAQVYGRPDGRSLAA